jgi:hypothetical protein
MSERTTALADELQRALDEVDRFIDEVSDEGWHAFSPGEQRTVAALICHIGISNTGLLNTIIKPVAEGAPGPSYTAEDLHSWNAAAAQQYAAASKAEARELLRSDASAAVAYVRELSDEQLGRSVEMALLPEPVTLEDTIAFVLAGHPRQHLASARAAAGMAD